jgi:hypothetical protein
MLVDPHHAFVTAVHPGNHISEITQRLRRRHTAVALPCHRDVPAETSMAPEQVINVLMLVGSLSLVVLTMWLSL